MSHHFTRTDLYEAVWSEPLRTIATRLKLSDVGLAKACRKAGIPVPPRGYWAKRDAGKRVMRTPLPPRGFGQSSTVEVGGSRYSYGVYDPTSPLPPKPMFEDNIAAVRDRAEQRFKEVAIRATLARPHRAIAQLLAKDDERREVAAKSKYAFLSDNPFFDAPFERRRLKILNALFTALEHAGFRASATGKHALGGSAQIGDTWVQFRLDSPGSKDEEDRLYGPRKPPGSMDLEFQIGSDSSRKWKDEKDRPLEDCLREILIAIVVHGGQAYRDHKNRTYEWAVERKEAHEQEFGRKPKTSYAANVSGLSRKRRRGLTCL